LYNIGDGSNISLGTYGVNQLKITDAAEGGSISLYFGSRSNIISSQNIIDGNRTFYLPDKNGTFALTSDITISNYSVVSFYSSGDMSVQLVDDTVPIPAVYGNINEASRVLLGSTGLANALVNNFYSLVILITATASPSSNFVIEAGSIFPSCVSMNIMSIDFTGTLSFNINPTSYPVLSELSITLGGCDALSFDAFDIPLLNLVTAVLSEDSGLLDQLINYIYATTTQNGGYCNFSGWSVLPTSSSLAARNALLARGWSFDFWA
jgi:hypothetical protein